MTNYNETIKRAKKYYQSGDDIDRNNLIDMYETLNEKEQKKADKEIVKFLPSWAE